MVSESVSVACNTGTITAISHFGLYKKDSEADQRGLCTSNSVSVNSGFDCSSLTGKDSSFYTSQLSTCVGQQSCLLQDIHSSLPLGNNGGDCNIAESDSLFIQYECKMDDDELTMKRHQALMAACVNVFAALTLLSVIRYRQGSISIEKREWDLQTVTASDYTLEIKLSKAQIA